MEICRVRGPFLLEHADAVVHGGAGVVPELVVL